MKHLGVVEDECDGAIIAKLNEHIGPKDPCFNLAKVAPAALRQGLELGLGDRWVTGPGEAWAEAFSPVI